MTTAEDVLWDYSEHTHAKHRLLRGYLDAWIPVMAGREPRVNLIDGFAGPGRYRGGEEGSPLVMLRAYLDHTYLPKMGGLKLNYIFIESDARRVSHLQEEIAKIPVPPSVGINVVEGSFDEVIGEELDQLPGGHRLVPSFVFIDPFGYTDHGIELSSRILAFPKCEVLIYVPWPHVARFVSTGQTDRALTNLFGDESWRAAVGLPGKEAERRLHELFLDKVRRAAGYAVSFEIDTTKGRGWSGYTLYFGTQHPLGLRKMKYVIWKLDPIAGSGFSYADHPDQLTIFEPSPDLSVLEALLAAHFEAREFSIEAADRFVLLDTPYSPDIHLKTLTLKVAEDAGRLEARHPTKPGRKRGTYPDGTVMRFRPRPAAGR